jgi:DNA-binding Xre family transcriptional regulator
MAARGHTPSIGVRWHLRALMAQKGLFATSDLVPLLSARGVVLSREQVYRLVTKTPLRLSLITLSALCDIFQCSPNELIEPLNYAGSDRQPTEPAGRAALAPIHPKRARITPEKSR